MAPEVAEILVQRLAEVIEKAGDAQARSSASMLRSLGQLSRPAGSI